jgi:arylsulfatase A-like enzyme
VQTVDVMPTVLDLLGVNAPGGLQGSSLAAAMTGGRIPQRPAFAEATNYGPERKALQDGRYKYVRVFPRAEPVAREIPVAVAEEEFFDLAADPQERTNLLAGGGPPLQELRSRLAAMVELNLSLRRAAPVESLDPETLRRLRSLGYIQ